VSDMKWGLAHNHKRPIPVTDYLGATSLWRVLREYNGTYMVVCIVVVRCWYLSFECARSTIELLL